jgi:hypothetical protein
MQQDKNRERPPTEQSKAVTALSLVRWKAGKTSGSVRLVPVLALYWLFLVVYVDIFFFLFRVFLFVFRVSFLYICSVLK